jgi:hypothetical protein
VLGVAVTRICDCTMVLTSSSALSSTSHLFNIPWERVSWFFSLGCLSANFSRSLGCREPRFPTFIWVSSATAHEVQTPGLTTTEPSDLSGLEPGSAAWDLAYIWVSLATASRQSSLPTWSSWESSDLSGLKPDGPLWVTFGHSSLAQPFVCLSWEPSDLSGLDSDSPPRLA